MLTKIVVAAVALTAAVVATAPAHAETNFGIGIGLGFGNHYGGGYDSDYYPVYDNDGISCWKGKKIVQNHGFYKVHATDCDGSIMRFKGKKSGDWFSIKMNRWGTIVDVDEL